jgi:hypothetical protein
MAFEFGLMLDVIRCLNISDEVEKGQNHSYGVFLIFSDTCPMLDVLR